MTSIATAHVMTDDGQTVQLAPIGPDGVEVISGAWHNGKGALCRHCERKGDPTPLDKLWADLGAAWRAGESMTVEVNGNTYKLATPKSGLIP